MVRRTWRDFKYEIADKLFGYELDEAYSQGIRIGAEYAVFHMTFNVKLSADKLPMTKTQKLGYERAIGVMDSMKPKISQVTGATL